MGTRGRPGAEPPTLELPERYRVRRHLASGGMASVWCAEDLVLERTVAVKVLAERFAHDEMALRRFKREARAAARVSTHAHVVTIFDVGDLEPVAAGGSGRGFIVMEYLAGGTVADAIRVGAVRRQESLRWVREAASALDHAHARGIVHRDIKPANFLLNRSRVLHVADFGIARLVSEDTISTGGELFGTAAYLSPEQALGREATGASDRYALAVVAFELLAAERPFDAKHFAAQARQHVEQPPPSASERDRTLPAAVDAVLIRGMAKQPDERFETAGAFVDALGSALSGAAPVANAAVTAARRRDRPPGRRLGGAAGAGRPARAGAARTRGAVRPQAAARADMPAGAARHTLNGGNGRRGPAAAAAPWTPADPLQRGSSSRRGAGRALALAALLVAIIGVGALAVSGLGGGKRPAPTAAQAHRAPARSPTHVRHPAKPEAVAQATTTATNSSTISSTPTPPAAPQSADQLQVTGYQEMLAGDYPKAIATLRKAVSAASPGTLTYAYGLYNLGKSLLLAGDASDAVPVLEQRIKIPDQTEVVQQTLNQALVAAGQSPIQPIQPIPPTPAKPSGRTPSAQDRKHAPTGSGGAGFGPPDHHGHGDGQEHASFVD